MFLTLTEAQVTSGVEAAGLGSGGPHSRPSPAAISRGSQGKGFSRGLVFSSVNEGLDHGIWGLSTRLDIL